MDTLSEEDVKKCHQHIKARLDEIMPLYHKLSLKLNDCKHVLEAQLNNREAGHSPYSLVGQVPYNAPVHSRKYPDARIVGVMVGKDSLISHIILYLGSRNNYQHVTPAVLLRDFAFLESNAPCGVSN
jgi:hypothetical protein